MATIVHESAPMPTLTAQRESDNGAMTDRIAATDYKHRSTVTAIFLAFLIFWYIFSPYLPQTVKQYFWAILH